MEVQIPVLKIGSQTYVWDPMKEEACSVGVFDPSGPFPQVKKGSSSETRSLHAHIDQDARALIESARTLAHEYEQHVDPIHVIAVGWPAFQFVFDDDAHEQVAKQFVGRVESHPKQGAPSWGYALHECILAAFARAYLAHRSRIGVSDLLVAAYHHTPFAQTLFEREGIDHKMVHRHSGLETTLLDVLVLIDEVIYQTVARLPAEIAEPSLNQRRAWAHMLLRQDGSLDQMEKEFHHWWHDWIEAQLTR